MILYLVVFAVLGLISFVCAVPMVFLAIWKRYWIAAEAVISKTDVKYSKDAERHLVTDYCIQYVFRVEGIQYSGADTIRVEVPYYEEKETMDQLRNDYAVGTTIEVYYPSSAPQVNSARREVTGLYRMIFVGTIGVFVAIVCYYLKYAMEISFHGHYYDH